VREPAISTIHPTAVISSEAVISADVHIAPFAVVDGPVTLGPGCVLHSHAHIIGPATLGKNNVVWPGAVLGGWPQDRKYHGEFSDLIIGDDNIFREGVTIHRGTGLNTRTVIGSRNYFMVNSHVGHNCTVGSDVTLVNCAALGGFAQVADRVIIGAFSSIHQFCRVGRLAMTTNTAGMNVDLPPFFISMVTNTITQLNAVGLRRSGMPKANIDALRRMFQVAFREQRRRPLAAALAGLPADVLAVPEVKEVIAFCKESKRGVALFQPWSEGQARIDSAAVKE
jgi:UDP-N-acetylglucosamine acyltransferase